MYVTAAVTLDIFVYVRLRCVANKLKRISKISTSPPPWKNFCGRLFLHVK